MILLFWKEAAGSEVTVTPGAGEVLIEGGLAATTVGAAPIVAAVSADTYGGGLYDRQLELQEEDALILQVIEAFLKKAA